MHDITVIMQISLRDYMVSCKEQTISSWEKWRDAQYVDDAYKAIVDDSFSEYIRTLDKIIESLVPF